MDFHGIPVGSIWTAIRWLPAFVLRRYFPREKLAALQYVDLMPATSPLGWTLARRLLSSYG